MSSSPRVLITGANGHVGGRLFDDLFSRRLVTLRGLMRSPRYLPAWRQNADILFGNLSDQDVQRSALRSVDCVVHLANRGFSAAEPPTSEELAEEQSRTLSFIRTAIATGVTRFIYVSSIHVYGDALVGAVDDATPTAPNSPFGRSRQNIEHAIRDLSSSTSSELIVVRLANSFGVPVIPRSETWNLLMHDLSRQVVASKSISLRSNPKVCRDMMALRDVVSVLSQLILSPMPLGGVYLLASGQTMSLLELAQLVRKLARDVLEVDIGISLPPESSSPPPTFSLHPERLIGAGITIPQNRDEEIRDLLRYAQREFGVTPS